MAASIPPPVVRIFFSCTGIRCDTSTLPNRYTIENPLHVLQLPAGAGYPLLLAELWLFFQFSDATGRYGFEVDLAWDVDSEVQHLHTFNVDFGTDRLTVRNFGVRLQYVPFPRPGIYDFRLRRGVEVLGRSAIRVEDRA